MTTSPPKWKAEELDIFLKIHNQLAHTANAGTYIYRGEHREFPKVSSSLYRRYEKTDEQGLGTGAIEEEILEQARAHAPEMTGDDMDDVIIAELRHNGGDMNVIDFTNDYLVANAVITTAHIRCS